MLIVVDDRKGVREAYVSMFERIGYPAMAIEPEGVQSWLGDLASNDRKSLMAILVGHIGDQLNKIRSIRGFTEAPIISIIDRSSLSDVLNSFDQGVDDVVRKPVHAQEILARASAIRRRTHVEKPGYEIGPLRIFSDGRDPQIDNEVFPLPRRERRILEYLASLGERRAQRSQIFAAVYGVMESDIEECVVESHLSKLRKKLKAALGYDVIDSKRYLGYRLISPAEVEPKELEPAAIASTRFTQGMAATV